MQFIFGDNTSKYTLLYFDDKLGNATKLQEMIRLPYSPHAQFDSLGFIPFGPNQNRSLFFKFQKDTKMQRNVYVLHGVYDEATPDYFFGGEYLNGMFTEFIDQTGFDELRDQLLAGKKDCDVPYRSNTELSAVPCERIPLDSVILSEIIAKLYQRTKIVLVMDDEDYDNDGVRLLLKKIFHYLTPSLRKGCSYITAVDNTGDMDFQIRIIPRSMLQRNEKAIDLNAPAVRYTDKSGFVEIADYLIALEDEQRDELFDIYETLHYGRDTIYKKQVFQDFFACYTCKEKDDDEYLNACEKILGDFLCDSKCPDAFKVPAFLQAALQERYSSAEELDQLISWDGIRLEEADGFYDTYIETIKKVYYLCDENLSYFEQRFQAVYDRVYSCEQLPDLKKQISRLDEFTDKLDNVYASEKRFFQIVLERCRELSILCNAYDKLSGAMLERLESNIRRDYSDCAILEVMPLVQTILGSYRDSIFKLEPYLEDIHTDLMTVLTEYARAHNNAYNEKLANEKAQRDKAYRIETLEIFSEQLKAVEEKMAKKQGASKKTEPAAEQTPPADPVGEAESFTDIFAMMESGAPAKREEVTEEDLLEVNYDEELRPILAEALVSYLTKVCLPRGEKPFVKLNLKLYMSGHFETMREVAILLREQKHTGLAILYLAAYCRNTEAMLQFILNVSADEIAPKEFAVIKKSLKDILEKNADRNGSDRVYEELIAQVNDLVGQKDCSSQRKTICKILLASPFMRVIKDAAEVDAEGESESTPKQANGFADKCKAFVSSLDKRTVMLVSIISGVALLLITALIVLVVVLGGNGSKDSDTDTTEKSKVTTTAKTDKEADGTTKAPDKSGEDGAGA